MMIEVGAGVVGKNDTSWGTTADGSPVLLVRSAAVTVRMVFTPLEAKEHGTAAIYLAVSSLLASQGVADTQRPASALYGPDGGPLG